MLSILPILENDWEIFLSFIKHILRENVNLGTKDNDGYNVLFTLCNKLAYISKSNFPNALDLMSIIIEKCDSESLLASDSTGRTLLDIEERVPGSALQDVQTLIRDKTNHKISQKGRVSYKYTIKSRIGDIGKEDIPKIEVLRKHNEAISSIDNKKNESKKASQFISTKLSDTYKNQNNNRKGLASIENIASFQNYHQNPNDNIINNKKMNHNDNENINPASRFNKSLNDIRSSICDNL